MWTYVQHEATSYRAGATNPVPALLVLIGVKIKLKGLVKMKINPEFKALIPSMKDEEYSQLEENILQDGIREPISIWQDFIIDGHNRFEIAKKHELEYATVEYTFDDESDVKIWIIKNQFGRRNLSSYERSVLALELKPLIAEKAKVNMSDGGKGSAISPDLRIDTRKELSIVAGVSDNTISKVEKIERSATPEIKQLVKNGDISVNQAAKIAEFNPEKQKEIAPLLEVGASIDKIIAKPHVAQNSGNNEWYTPVEYIEAANNVMGSIDYDPASSNVAQKVVQAKNYETIETNGLDKSWYGNVWLNPPYAGDLIVKFVNKLYHEVQIGNIKQAIILVNNATETVWFNSIVEIASAIVFPKGRVKFYMSNGETGAPLQGQAFLYIGNNPNKFLDCFKQFGWGALI